MRLTIMERSPIGKLLLPTLSALLFAAGGHFMGEPVFWSRSVLSTRCVGSVLQCSLNRPSLWLLKIAGQLWGSVGLVPQEIQMRCRGPVRSSHVTLTRTIGERGLERS